MGVDSGGVMGEEGEEVEGNYDQNIFEITKELIRVLDYKSLIVPDKSQGWFFKKKIII